MHRRRFLQALGTGAAATMLPGRGASAPVQTWGSGDAAMREALLPEGVRAERVLEVVLMGGMGAFESFYVVPEHGRPDDPRHPNQQWHLFADDHAEWFGDRCGLEPSSWLTPFATDADGHQVYFGPLAAELIARPDVLARTRVLVRRHDAPIHLVATPYTLTGRRPSDPRMAGMGTHVTRYFSEREGRSRDTPHAYVLVGAGTPDTTARARAAATHGMHSPVMSPLTVQARPNGRLLAQLHRDGLAGRTEAFDALASLYARGAASAYPHVLREQSMDDYRAALDAVSRAPSLVGLLDPDLFEIQEASTCGDVLDNPSSGLFDAAARLLQAEDPDRAARFVTVIHNGLGGDGWDSHNQHMQDQCRAMPLMLRSLLDHVNRPGEQDPAKIDLDDTMISLVTEFGRAPYREAGTINGTDHWPDGYVTLLIGGPVEAGDQPLAGAIGADGRATSSVSIEAGRAALLAAMGIDPFESEGFDLTDMGAGTLSRPAALRWLHQTVLGRAA